MKQRESSGSRHNIGIGRAETHTMTNQTILVVEDDAKIRTLLRNVLEGEGFSVFEAGCATEAWDIIKKSTVNLITLDLHLGRDDGLQLARDIRAQFRVPIVMVTGKDDVIDRVVGLEIGADDYIAKPFHIREVVARIRSVLRRTEQSTPPETAKETAVSVLSEDECLQFQFDGLIAIPDRLELLDRSGADCGLTSGDFRLLNVFLQRPKRVLSRDQLMDLTGGHQWSPLDRTIDNQIARLRKKIEREPSDPKLIKTVRGMGYTFACDVQKVQQPGASPKRA
jgi:DNA-binding response OmpR family regulator